MDPIPSSSQNTPWYQKFNVTLLGGAVSDAAIKKRPFVLGGLEVASTALPFYVIRDSYALSIRPYVPLLLTGDSSVYHFRAGLGGSLAIGGFLNDDATAPASLGVILGAAPVKTFGASETVDLQLSGRAGFRYQNIGVSVGAMTFLALDGTALDSLTGQNGPNIFLFGAITGYFKDYSAVQ